MKYLRIHKLIWLLLVVIYTFLEIPYYGILYIGYFIWCLKIDKNFWCMYHDNENYKLIEGKVYRYISFDKTPLDTIKRRYNYILKYK